MGILIAFLILVAAIALITMLLSKNSKLEAEIKQCKEGTWRDRSKDTSRPYFMEGYWIKGPGLSSAVYLDTTTENRVEVKNLMNIAHQEGSKQRSS